VDGLPSGENDLVSGVFARVQRRSETGEQGPRVIDRLAAAGAQDVFRGFAAVLALRAVFLAHARLDRVGWALPVTVSLVSGPLASASGLAQFSVTATRQITGVLYVIPQLPPTAILLSGRG
jgi:hypothetical protein